LGRDAIPGKRSEHRTEDVVPETGARRRLRQAAAPPPPAITIHPNASEIYRRKIAELAAALASPNIRGQAAKALRDLIEQIAVTAEGDGNAVELAGELAALLGAAGTKNAASLGEAARSALLVAGSATSVTCKPCELGYGTESFALSWTATPNRSTSAHSSASINRPQAVTERRRRSCSRGSRNIMKISRTRSGCGRLIL
jgi:hypothetical protein